MKLMNYKTPIHVLVCEEGRKTTVILKLMVKITSIFGSYVQVLKNRMA